MTPEHLRELIAAGESLDVELKGEAHGPLSDTDLVDAVVCLSNRPADEPGWLLIGMDDDGCVTGAVPRHEAGVTDPTRLQALIANRTRPSVAVRVEIVDLTIGPVIAVEVPAALSPMGTADGRYTRRAMGGDGKPACGTCQPTRTGGLGTPLPMSASAGSSQFNRSRWFCSMWTSTAGSRGGRLQSYAAWDPTRRHAFLGAWWSARSYRCTAPRGERGIRARRNSYTRAY